MQNDDSKSGDGYEKVGEFVSIFERGGIWQVNYQFEGRQFRSSLRTRSKKEARRRALLIERDLLAGEHQSRKRAPLLQDVIDAYTAHLRAEGRTEKTIRKYVYCFSILLEVAQRRKVKRISQLDVAMVDAFRADRAEGQSGRRPAKPKTIHNDTVCVRQLVNFALRRDLIADDPLKGHKIMKPKRTPQPCWSREQVDQILETAKPPHRAALIFLAETGCRVAEAKWLTWDDVDFDRQLIHIRAKDGWKPKSGDNRVIPLNGRLLVTLQALPRQHRWVFTARVNREHPEPGRQISERRLLQYLKRVLERLNLPGHLHTFRHSFISFAACHGVPERILRKWIGHVDREILDWYFHLADKQSQDAMQRLTAAADKTTNDENGAGTEKTEPAPGDSKPAQSQHKPKGEDHENSAK